MLTSTQSSGTSYGEENETEQDFLTRLAQAT